ncbi:hypothetical protein [Rhizobium sp. SYY.PMSO]|uniref:hypothetical protein n=1 Tax=Rhizobium sp. SYY.PMSO TaxID=3382192 RepID=UPI00398FAEC4
MKPNTAAQARKDESRKRRRAADRWRKWIEDLHRRQQRAERDRRRRWLLTLLLALLESKPVQAFSPVDFAAQYPTQQKRQPELPRKSEKKAPSADTISDYDRHYLYDHRPRRGEEHLEVYDGLTYEDIAAYNREHRPRLSPKFLHIPGMPKRYSDEPVHIWTLLFEMQYPHARPDAITALKLIVDPSAHAWIDACAAETNGLTWKDLSRQCRRRTPEMTAREFPRAAERWREELRSEAEERKKEAKETPSTGPKPPGSD